MVAAPSNTHKPPKTGGDDLDDGLDLDADLVGSGDEGEGDGSGSEDGTPADFGAADVEGEGDLPMLEELDSREGVKRKRDGEGSSKTEEDEEEVIDEEERKRRKKAKMKEKHKERKAKRANTDATPATAGTYLPTTSLLALLTSSLLSSNPSLTPLETSSILPPLDSLLPPPDHKQDPSIPIDSLDPLRRRIAGLLKKNGKIIPSKPRVILLCLSGIRCADMVREVRTVQGDGVVAKLFAKHMKANEQAEFLKSKKVSIAVGTPARVGRLLADGALQVDKNTILLLDIGHKDAKTRTLLDLPEIRDEMWKSIFQGDARKALLEGGARIGAF